MKKVGVLLRNKLNVRKKPMKCFKEQKEQGKERVGRRKRQQKKEKATILFSVFLLCRKNAEVAFSWKTLATS